MPQSTARPIVVFDLGGVLISPITTLLAEISEWHGVSMVEMLDVLMGPREVSTDDHPWHRAERGELATAEMSTEVQPFAERVGLTLRGDEYDRLLCGVFDVHHDMIERIAALRAEGYTLGLLTNSFREFRDHLEAHIDFSLFDVVVDSSEVGMRKPEPRIYELTTQLLGGDPSAIVYVDDFLANVEGAREAGWTVIHLASTAQALADLDKVLS